MSIQFVSKEEKKELTRVLNNLENWAVRSLEAPGESCVEPAQSLICKLTQRDIEWLSSPAKIETFPKVKSILLDLHKAVYGPLLPSESAEELRYKVNVCRNYLQRLPEAARI